MKKKRVIFTILVILLVFAGFFVAGLIRDLKKEQLIKNEISKISKVFGTENIDNDDVNAILDRRLIKKGDYAVVEDSIKKYYKDLYDDLKNITFLLEEDNYSDFLSSKNINEDGPSFVKSKNKIQNTKAQLADCYQEFINQLESESVKISYVLDKDLTRYYKNFYLDLSDDLIDTSIKNSIEKSYKNILKKIDIYNDALDFLIATKGHWQLKNDVIAFERPEDFEVYKEIIDKLETSES